MWPDRSAASSGLRRVPVPSFQELLTAPTTRLQGQRHCRDRRCTLRRRLSAAGARRPRPTAGSGRRPITPCPRPAACVAPSRSRSPEPTPNRRWWFRCRRLVLGCSRRRRGRGGRSAGTCSALARAGRRRPRPGWWLSRRDFSNIASARQCHGRDTITVGRAIPECLTQSCRRRLSAPPMPAKPPSGRRAWTAVTSRDSPALRHTRRAGHRSAIGLARRLRRGRRVKIRAGRPGSICAPASSVTLSNSSSRQ